MNKKLREALIKFFAIQFPEYEKEIAEDFSKVKITDKGFIPFLLKLFHYKGICLFRKIYFVKGTLNRPESFRYIAHELVHTVQYRREGIIKFPIKYVIDVIKNGYKESKYEEEAVYYEKMFVIWCKKERILLDVIKDRLI